jgi:hypothetical protein
MTKTKDTSEPCDLTGGAILTDQALEDASKDASKDAAAQVATVLAGYELGDGEMPESWNPGGGK